jgi:hypothetical protein
MGCVHANGIEATGRQAIGGQAACDQPACDKVPAGVVRAPHGRHYDGLPPDHGNTRAAAAGGARAILR